jgi:hypothetical protein
MKTITSVSLTFCIFLYNFSFLHVSSKIFNSVPPTNTRVCKNYRSATEKQNGSDSYKDFGDFLPTVKAIKDKIFNLLNTGAQKHIYTKHLPCSNVNV